MEFIRILITSNDSMCFFWYLMKCILEDMPQSGLHNYDIVLLREEILLNNFYHNEGLSSKVVSTID